MRRQSIAFRLWPWYLSRAGKIFFRSFSMRSLLSSFLSDQSGATAIEYALIAMGIAIVIVAGVNGIGTKLSGTFDQVSASLK
jgi:pilus assembly protein Flp/PilA